jgi:hypothetical protein
LKNDCLVFRGALEGALQVPRPLASTAPLAWHAHLLACEECRELLAEEEALESLLMLLPASREGELPRSLVDRLLARLRGERQSVRLDALLELDRLPKAPLGLAERVLQGVRAESVFPEPELDELLARGDPLTEAWRQLRRPSVREPMSERILANLAADRAAGREPIRARFPRAVWLATALAASLALWLWLAPRGDRGTNPGSRPNEPLALDMGPSDGSPLGTEAVPEELLAALDYFEQWEALDDSELNELLLEAVELEVLLAALEDSTWIEETNTNGESNGARAPKADFPTGDSQG